MKMGCVYLIGGGCGEYDLITLRGLKILQKCDTVVYDSLVDTKLLEFCCQNAEKICVGKRAGKHSETQKNINKIIVEKALQGRSVARLKGGDSFVFGRGGEEILSLKEYNIPYSIIPGVTSCVAVPELAGIPVTHRNLSRSFHVITGHTSEDLLPENLYSLAKLNGTLVFLMGLGHLREISQGLLDGGMDGETPAAVICNGGTPKQRIILDSLSEIYNTALQNNAETPAVIVIGKTVALGLSPTLKLPLDGVTVAVTGTEKTVNKLSARLEELGGRAVCAGKFHLEPAPANSDFDRALLKLSDYGTLVLTSPNGAEIFLNRLKHLKIDVRKLGQLKLAVIGRGTAEILENAGIFPELMPLSFNTASLGKLIADSVCKEERVLILRSSEGSAELTKILDRNAISYDDISSYKPIYDMVCTGEVTADYITFASAGGVRGFFRAGGKISGKTTVLCIGEITASALKEYGISDSKIAKVSSVQGMTDLILEEVKCVDSDV